MLGLGFLTWGAEWLVRGSSKLARAVGISPLAIGLTVVAYGTSSPELVVNIQSALVGQHDIAIGNIVGSNIFNVLFILGLCALIWPLPVSRTLIKWDVPVMIGVAILFYLFALNGRLERGEGFIFVVLVGVYTYFCFTKSKKEAKELKKEFEQEFGEDPAVLRSFPKIAADLFFILSGLILLVVGAKWLVNSSVDIARHLGVSELVIALTIVAAGTSLPEVFTSIVATIKGERDIAIGNVVGSNIYNILAILGVTALIPRQGLLVNPKSMTVDIPFMLVISMLCYPFFRSGNKISRIEGAVFLFLYIGYTVFLIQTNH